MTLRTFARAAAVALAAMLAAPGGAAAQVVEITGTVNWDRGTALPPGSLLTVRLLDVGREDEALELASIALRPTEEPPTRFRLFYDEKLIERGGAYRLTARITVGRLALLESIRATPVITTGSFTDPEILLERIQIARGPGEESPIGPEWTLVAILGEPVDGATRASLTLGDDGIATGSTGCNRYRARYEISPEVLDLGSLSMTRKGCPTPIRRIEKRVLSALRDVRGWRMNAGELILTDIAGGEMMRFE